MSVRKLAGPYSLVNSDTSAVSSTGSSPTFAMWIPNFGLLVWLQNAFTLVALDGVCIDLARLQWGVASGSFWTYIVNQGILKTVNYVGGSGGEYNREPVILCPYAYSGPFGNATLPGLNLTAVDLSTRRITMNGSAQVVSSTGGAYTVEHAAISGVSGMPIVGPGRSASEIMVSSVNAGSDLTFVFYDTLGKAFSSQVFHLGVAAIAAVFAPELGVVVSLHGNGSSTPYTLNVWSLDVIPTAVSSVTLVSTTATKQGQVATYAVTVTGAQGEPVIGYLVDWSISGSGTLVTTQSTTDVNGKATVQVFHGLTDTVASVVTASVTV